MSEHFSAAYSSTASAGTKGKYLQGSWISSWKTSANLNWTVIILFGEQPNLDLLQSLYTTLCIKKGNGPGQRDQFWSKPMQLFASQPERGFQRNLLSYLLCLPSEQGQEYEKGAPLEKWRWVLDTAHRDRIVYLWQYSCSWIRYGYIFHKVKMLLLLYFVAAVL